MPDIIASFFNHPPALIVVALLGGYLSGSVPYGLILTRIAGLGDVRRIGSGNIGATNVLRTGNKAVAAATLLLDALKGFVPAAVAAQTHADLAVMAGLAALLGHIFPVWLAFKGGKGVATGIGVAMGLAWPLGVAIILLWLATAAITRISSLSALVSFAGAAALSFVLAPRPEVSGAMILIAVIVWITHHDNLRRLATGQESRISLSSGKNDDA